MTSASDQLPDPPLAPDIDLRSFDKMPLDTKALFNSTTWLRAKRQPFLAYALVNVWARAWHEVPAGSLPNDDDLLQAIADVDDLTWVAIKEYVLHNFVLCSDGRRYHETICSLAVDAAKHQTTRSRSAKKAANVRWGNKKKLNASRNAVAVHRQSASMPGKRGEEKGKEDKDDGGGAHTLDSEDSPKGRRSPAAGTSGYHPHYHEVGGKVLEIMQVTNDPRWLGNYGAVDSWLKAGWDPEADIYPTVERVMQLKSDGPPFSLKYFTPAIQRAHSERTLGLTSDDLAPRQHPKVTAAEELDRAFAKMDRDVLGESWAQSARPRGKMTAAKELNRASANMDRIVLGDGA